jgi:crotonobetainyl-CoA:carnitine CoA-transferase CaiB-like acyl-CoA transferase
LSDVFENEQVIARELRLNLPHSRLGKVPSVACPIRFDGRALPYPAGPPALGEHTDIVLAEWLGLTASSRGST